MIYKTMYNVGGKEFTQNYLHTPHYDNFGNTVLLTDEDGVPQYTALYDISNGKRVQEWNPNNLTFAFKGEGKEEKISFGISDIQISIFDDLVIRKKIPIAIIGNWTWIDLTAKGGATLKTCGGKCPAERPYYICFCYYVEKIEHKSNIRTKSINSNCSKTIQKGLYTYTLQYESCDCYGLIMEE